MHCRKKATCCLVQHCRSDYESVSSVSTEYSVQHILIRICLFVCLERALARIPTLRRPVELIYVVVYFLILIKIFFLGITQH